MTVTDPGTQNITRILTCTGGLVAGSISLDSPAFAAQDDMPSVGTPVNYL